MGRERLANMQRIHGDRTGVPPASLACTALCPMTAPADKHSLIAAFDALAQARSRRVRSAPWLPFAVIGLLAVLIAGLFVAMVLEDRQLRRDAMYRDIDAVAQQITLRLAALGETLTTAALEIGAGTIGDRRFASVASELVASKREVIQIRFVDARGRPVWPLPSTRSGVGSNAVETSLQPVLAHARAAGTATFALVGDGTTDASIVLIVPSFAQARYVGAIVARISPNELLSAGVAPEIADRYRLALQSPAGPLASTTASAPPPNALGYSTGVSPLPPEVRLHATAYKLESGLVGSALVWVVAALAAAVAIALGALAHYTSRQARIDRALLAETALRRAMEDSMATGLSVFDNDGVLRYVNRAFCQMTGWAERDLIGRGAPLPYWPADAHAEHERNLRRILAADIPTAGFEVQVLRADGARFDARMYVSPLVDDAGRQIGWMSSMADVTEPKRIRSELAAAHERFTTVLESLEAAVSVVPAGAADEGDALLFANREYRARFGETDAGHRRLAQRLRARGGPEMSGEALDEASGRWYDVRMREIRWPAKDYGGGRAARLQVATDITLRKTTEEIARQQQEKVQFTSRLMTMGEMASSLAHELNQPLTAIVNYSEGTLARLRAGPVPPAELHAALEKMSTQAQRAGRIIRRIREFVKRSEPRRRPTPAQRIVDDAIAFAEIEAGKRNIAIAAAVDPTLPRLDVDPILIEQVLLNLLKNAIDAMEHAIVRRIDVVVTRAPVDGMAEIAVVDRGSGIPQAHLANVFQPFFSTKSEGMGMGLNICRSIIEFHQGRLHLDNNPEPTGGSIVRFTLPLAWDARGSDNSREPDEAASEAARK
ncbi:MAG: oxygen sensor histidine kinase FixL [Burkholderiaceae bacterium]